MSYQLVYSTVRESPRSAIFVVRVQGEILEPLEIDEITERMREWLASRGELVADVVVVQGSSKQALRFFGSSYSVALVRSALLGTDVAWKPLNLH